MHAFFGDLAQVAKAEYLEATRVGQDRLVPADEIMQATEGADDIKAAAVAVVFVDDAEADAVSLGERIPITPLVAFGYMVFVLIYFPCIATLAAIKGESGSWKWALFAAVYTTVLAWVVSFAIYQIGGLFG